jgi:sterol desaturase/sphingolipid hydroxylase (fatty acid hydroxylase superfamily)
MSGTDEPVIDDLPFQLPELTATMQQIGGVVDHHLQGVLLSAVLIAAFTACEVKWPSAAVASLGMRLINIAIGLIVAVFAFLCTLLLSWFVPLFWPEGLIGLLVPSWSRGGVAGTAIAVVTYGVVWDFFQYWFHRWQHMSASLWPSHRVHHSDETLNTTSALRRSVLELILIFLFVLVPTVIVVGVHELAAAIAFAIFYGWGFFNHANIRLSLGVLTPVFSGPQWHRLHHAVNPEYRDRNFAAYFPVLDIVFGTYQAPSGNDCFTTGVSDADVTAHPFRDCLLPRRR